MKVADVLSILRKTNERISILHEAPGKARYESCLTPEKVWHLYGDRDVKWITGDFGCFFTICIELKEEAK